MVQTAEAEHLEEPWTEEIDRDLTDRDLTRRIEPGVRAGV